MTWGEAVKFARDIMEINAWQTLPDSYIAEGELVESLEDLEEPKDKMVPIDGRAFGGFTIPKWKK